MRHVPSTLGFGSLTLKILGLGLCCGIVACGCSKNAPPPPKIVAPRPVAVAPEQPAAAADLASLRQSLAVAGDKNVRVLLIDDIAKLGQNAKPALDDLLACATDADPQALWNHPLWWVQRLQREYPDHWEGLLMASNAQAPMTLRVNLRRCTAADYLQRLHEAGMGAVAAQGAAIVLDKAVPVTRLPGFAQGLVAVQDAAAQLAAPLLLQGLGAQPRILDACAAPGGKTAHLLELADAQVLAIDKDAQRLEKIHANLQRLGLHALVRQGDAANPQAWWDGVLFDGILLDAPCTASGIVRRHPDVRWLRREEDIAQLAALQAQMLRALWPLLRPGGRMVYCTCSVFKAEGQEQIEEFLGTQGDALSLPAPGHLLPGGTPQGLYDNLGHDHDGFFYALLEKRHA